ncbi:MAG: transcriptional repressor LexA [Rhodospirillales bacterium]
MLTRKQHELLVYIDRRIKQTGVSPSFDEMKQALGLRSKSGIHRLISGLEERGFIKRLAHRARALEVIRLPDNLDQLEQIKAKAKKAAAPEKAKKQKADKSFSPNVIEGTFKLRGAASEAANDSVELPLYGRIAAGTPIEALRDHTHTIDIPASMIGKGEHYALEVDGDSMIDAGIQDGDTVLIQRCDTAENGAIVVALVEENEVTLKRLRRKGHSVALEPANKRYETRIFGPDQVKVQGKLIGLFRKY